MGKKITVVQVRRATTPDINQELQWLGNSLGLFSERDKDKSCFRVFITLVKRAKDQPISSDTIAEQLHLARGTVVHHLAKLMDTGIVIRERQGYILRDSSLHAVIENLQRDMDALFRDLFTVAERIDEKLS